MSGQGAADPVHNSSVLWNFYKPRYWRRNRRTTFCADEPEDGSTTDNGPLSDTEILQTGVPLTDVVDSPREHESDQRSSPESPGSSSRPRPRPRRRRYDPRRYVGRSTVYSSMGSPPRGYLWIWLGHFKRWHRRFFVLTTPGVVVYSKRPDTKGGKWTINLKGSSVVVGRGNPRQFCLVTSARVVYLRTLSRGDRDTWVTCIQKSKEKYDEFEERTRDFRGDTRRLEQSHSYSLEADPEMQSFQRDLWVRMYAKTSLLRPHRDEIERHLVELGQTMSKVTSIVGNLNPDSSTHPSDSQNHATANFDDTAEVSSSRTTQCSFSEGHPGTSYPSTGMEAPQLTPSSSNFATSSSTIWSSYNNFVMAVEQALKDEVVKVLELQAENSALRQLLRDRQLGLNRFGSLKDIPNVRIDANELSLRGSVPKATSLATSGTYSTAGSEFDDENSEDSQPEGEEHMLSTEPGPSGKAGVTPQDSPTRAVVDDELIRALEVVRMVEYASRGKTKAEFEEEDGQGGEPPAGTDDEDNDDDEDDDDNDDDDDAVMGDREDSDISSPTGSTRSRLPCPRPLRRGFSIWSILKNAIGRDLTRITLPATINEPLSALQRVAEEFEYYSLLEKAAECDDPQERLVYVAVFALSSYNSALMRDNKPFNPLLGETFEWQGDGIQFLAEQVSHHPPVSCFNAKGLKSDGEGPRFLVHGEFELRSKFWGKSLYVYPTGRCELFLVDRNEKYVWNKSNISIHNIIIGRLWLDFSGEVSVQNITTGSSATINIPKCGGYLDRRGKVEGTIRTPEGQVSHKISGNYRNAMSVTDEREGSEKGTFDVFQCNEPPEDSQEQYNMTKFAIGLNDLRGAAFDSLPRSDARFRPDVRALENGEFDLATSEKLRLEEKQREARRKRKESGGKYTPMWFKQRVEEDKELVKTMAWKGQSAWEFRDEYWEKDPTKFELSPDIYSE